MKFIYQMVEDGSYAAFKLMTKAAQAGNQKQFVWAGIRLETNYAHFVCEYVDKFLLIDYEDYLEHKAQIHYESD